MYYSSADSRGRKASDLRSIDSRVGMVMLDSPAQQATNVRSIFRKAARRRLSDDRSDRIWTVSMVTGYS